ncbi:MULTISPECIES: pentapeptide repeat-containing protein [Cyanophyceae]|uniref:pentapeptide repeat-containing protein n=1 Tax=Cyanophyceae TaxID=3028117 RepID=UPI001684F1DF|nr:pentapeptide repeat-containing protein [Trichocoleus sp. FACHB-69]MBD1932089.1 pentapeptide repeat-containing protein [Trichocoleus sp. FACHB-69]
MANEEHLEILKQGVEVWNRWRKENPNVSPDLGYVSFSGINLDGFDLSKTCLWYSSFGGSSLRGTLLTWSFLQNSYLLGIDLTGADLRRASLHEANLTVACLYRADLRGAFLTQTDLSSADLREANLYQAQISKTHLIATNLEGANLSEAFLAYSHGLAANFKRAILTGACIEALNTDDRTSFDDVICDYVYLRYDKQERRPHSGNFKPGEFTKLFQKARVTVDLIFRHGIDWQAFLVSFQQLQVEAGDKVLSIQAIEDKNDGAFVIRISVPPELDKAEIENFFKQKYQLALKNKDEQYRKYLRERLNDKDSVINCYNEQIKLMRKENTNLLEFIKIMAEQENSKINNTFYISGSPGSIANQGNLGSSGNQNSIGNTAGDVKGNQESIQNNYNYTFEQKQILAEAEAEIQELLKQQRTQGYSPEAAQQKVASDLAIKANNDPAVKSKLEKWGQYLGDAAVNGLIGEAVVTVVKSALQFLGLPIP